VVLHQILGGVGCQGTNLLREVTESLHGLVQALAAESSL